MAALTVYKRAPSASPYVSRLREQLATANEARKTALAKARGNVAGKGNTLMAAGIVASGGVTAAVVNKYLPEDAIGIDNRWIAGGGLVAAGAFAVGGKPGMALILNGAGCLACAVEDAVSDMLPDLGGEE